MSLDPLSRNELPEYELIFRGAEQTLGTRLEDDPMEVASRIHRNQWDAGKHRS